MPASVNPISETLSQVKAGSLRILAVTGAKRSSFLPDIPTMTEAGYDVAVESWLGVFLPVKTPAETVNALNAALGEATRSRELTEGLANIGNEPAHQSPGEFAATVKADIDRWGPVVKASGFVAED